MEHVTTDLVARILGFSALAAGAICVLMFYIAVPRNQWKYTVGATLEFIAFDLGLALVVYFIPFAVTYMLTTFG